jgi:hypothetical protein
MMTATSRTSRTLQHAAKLALGASSVAPVAYGYERSLRPSAHGFSRLSRTIRTGGDL